MACRSLLLVLSNLNLATITLDFLYFLKFFYLSCVDIFVWGSKQTSHKFNTILTAFATSEKDSSLLLAVPLFLRQEGH